MRQKGSSLISLMTTVAIIAILITMATPIYNHHIEKTKTANTTPVIGNYKNAIADCFLRNDNLNVCNDGAQGIPQGINNKNNILSLDVNKGSIILTIKSQNHYNDTSPIKLNYKPSQQTSPDDVSLDWNLFCNDYAGNGTRLLKTCQGKIKNDNNGNDEDDSSLWEPTEPAFNDWTIIDEKTTGPWEPAIDEQTADFEQSRSIEQTKQREKIIQEKNKITGQVREKFRTIETVKEKTQEETRLIDVTLKTGNQNNPWSNKGEQFNCNDWGAEWKSETISIEHEWERYHSSSEGAIGHENYDSWANQKRQQWPCSSSKWECKLEHDHPFFFVIHRREVPGVEYYQNKTLTAWQKCSQKQEKIIEYRTKGELITTTTKNKVLNNVQSTEKIADTKEALRKTEWERYHSSSEGQVGHDNYESWAQNKMQQWPCNSSEWECELEHDHPSFFVIYRRPIQ